MIDIERTLRLLDVEAESHFVQAEAIDAINYLLRENARLREALKPFANEAQFIADRALDDFVWDDWDTVTVGQIRAAAAAIREGGKDE